MHAENRFGLIVWYYESTMSTDMLFLFCITLLHVVVVWIPGVLGLQGV